MKKYFTQRHKATKKGAIIATPFFSASSALSARKILYPGPSGQPNSNDTALNNITASTIAREA